MFLRMSTHEAPGGPALAMKRISRRFVLFTALACPLGGVAFAGTGDTSSSPGTGQAVVVAPIVLNHVSGSALSFGAFTTGTGGSVSVSPAGTATPTGDIGMVPSVAASADQFSVTGNANAAISITSAPGTVSNGSTTMAFTTAPSFNNASLTLAGTGAFSVGGTLTATGTEPAGNYTGTYAVTVSYF